MRLNSKWLLGLICLVVGVFLIIYAQHSLHHEVVQTKPFFEKVRDFFVGVGNWFKGTATTTAPAHKHTSLKVLLWLGVALSALGVLTLILPRRK